MFAGTGKEAWLVCVNNADENYARLCNYHFSLVVI